MRRAAAVSFVILAALAFAYAQKPAELPDKPINPKAGRILQLEEDLRITDEGGEFFLKYPRLVTAAPDGTLYLLDQEQIIHFDASGKFLGNLFRKGQGPGELSYVSGLEATAEGLVVHNNSPNKLVWFDNGGKYRREASLQKAGSRLEFLSLSGGRVIGLQMLLPPPGGGPGVRMKDTALLSVSLEGSDVSNPAVFPIRTLQIGGAMLWDNLMGVVSRSRYVAVVHTKNYLIKIIDLQKPGTPVSFGRKYKQVSVPKDYRGRAIISSDGTKHTLPGAEFLDDIAALHAYKDVLWVQTSTKDSDKGILFDVFDMEGKYLDAFYLKTSGRLLNVQGDSLFIRESALDDTLRIVRYKVVG